MGLVSAIALLVASACDDLEAERQDESEVSASDAGAGDDSPPDVMDAGDMEGDEGGARDAGSEVEPPRPTLDAGPDAGDEPAPPPGDAGSEPDDAGDDAGTNDDGDAAIDGDDASTEDPDASIEEPTLPVLAAHYTFDESTGTVAADATGQLADAVLLDGASFSAGVHGGAVELSGGATTEHVSLPVDILEGCEDLTIALWMKLGSTPFWSRLLDIDGTIDGFVFFTPTQDVGGAPHLFFNIFHPTGTGANDQGVSAPYPEGTTLVDQWHHVAFTLSGGTGRLYFDGVEIGANPMATTPSDLTLGDAAHAWIGRSTFPDPYLDAAIDDLRISCAAYTAEQIAAIAE